MRDLQAQRLRGAQVQRQLETRRLVHGERRGRLSFQHPGQEVRAAPDIFLLVRRVGDQAAQLDGFPVPVDDRDALLERRELAKFRGREIDTAGDGFLAAFDGPARAVRCAQAIQSTLRTTLEIDVRAGLHTGECELMEGKLSGLAVHIGARVAALAKPGEVLVSNTVKDLVAGSGLAFEDRGDHVLKGVPGQWHLYCAGQTAAQEGKP